MNPVTLLAAFGIGAVVTYNLDPDRGARRRALMRDRLVSARSAADDAVEATGRDVGNRARGLGAGIRSRLNRDDGADDIVVGERVRTRLGRLVSHPRPIDVSVSNGRVTLGGPVFSREADRLVKRVASVRGVRSVEDRLDRRQSAGDEPGLRSGGASRRRAGDRMEFMQVNWSPSARLVAGATGAGLMVYGLARAGALGTAAGIGGALLLARAAFNLELTWSIGVGGAQGAFTFDKTVEVAAPVEEVFELWSRYENFPRFMSHVREVQRLPDDRSQWVVSGPAGVPVTWQTVETARVPNEVLAWRTEPRGGDTVSHAGMVRFGRTPNGGTRLHITMSYTPVGGALGHGVAALFGSDPKRAMNDDLVRFKSLLENGKTTAHSQTVRREDVG